jgi:hypothetical protein
MATPTHNLAVIEPRKGGPPLVIHHVIGLFTAFRPKFVRRDARGTDERDGATHDRHGVADPVGGALVASGAFGHQKVTFRR